MKQDKHENCVRTVVLNCANCGHATQFETAESENVKCPKCGFKPGSSLVGALPKHSIVVQRQKTRIKPMNRKHVERSWERFRQKRVA